MNQTIELYLSATIETLIMTIVPSILAFLAGLPLGILLQTTSEKGLNPNKVVNTIVGSIVNILRSVPFIILMLYVMPLSRLLVQTTIGVKAMIPALSISAIPFVARLTESAFNEVDSGLVEATKSMGASNSQIIKHVMMVEARVSLVRAATVSMITILGYGAMSGFVGAGGLGTIAINYGYYRNQSSVMTICIVILVILVQIIQSIGNKLAVKINRKH
ncbi:MAG: ABC transporter permease [Erysipelothrix sp.]|nr:ABC transporter permease [Erysipelothrix sp.]